MLDNVLDMYVLASNSFEKGLSESFKKNYGVYYTDLKLSKSILSNLRIKQNDTVLDPCCGLGSFIYQSQQMGIKYIYGADIDKDTVTYCRKLTQSHNVFLCDTLGISGKQVLSNLNVDEKVDFVIGNPPYAVISDNNIKTTKNNMHFINEVKSSGNNLFVAAIYRAFELVKPQGYISYIIPKNFLHVKSYKRLRQYILKNKRIVSIVDLGMHFKQVRGEQIVLTMQNTYRSENRIKFYKYTGEVNNFVLSVKQVDYDDCITFFDSKDEYNLYWKFKIFYKQLGDMCKGYSGRGKSKDVNAIAGRDIRKFGFKDMPIQTEGNQVFIQNIYSTESGIIASFAGNLQARETVTVFTDSNSEMCRYIVGLLHSKLCNYYLTKFCFNNSKLTMHTDAKYIRTIPFIVKDYTFDKIVRLVKIIEEETYMSDTWFSLLDTLNEEIYDTYELNAKERDIIENQIAKIQSNKWNGNIR